MKKRMDESSLEAWHAKRTQFEKRKREILEAIGGDCLTVRQIKDRMGKLDMNEVRPRVTELLQMGVLEKIGRQPDPLTGVPVMLVRRAVAGAPASETHAMSGDSLFPEIQP